MESVNYENFITSTVESFLPRFTDPKICLSMVVRMSWTDHGYDEDGNTKVREERRFSKAFFVIFHRPNNYTRVLIKDVSDDRVFIRTRFQKGVKGFEMKQVSNHDSCWRSDGMQWVFKSFCEAWDHFEELGIEGRDIDPYVGYDLSGDPKFHEIEMKQIDEDGYLYNVKIGEKIEMADVGKYMTTY